MRVIRNLSDSARNKNTVDMEIPNVGIFRVRNNVSAVTFSEFLLRDTKGITNKSLNEKKSKGEMTLTKDTIKKFEKYFEFEEKLKNKDILEIDENTKSYLKKSMNIDVTTIYENKS